MKLSERIIKICKNHTKVFSSCKKCLIEIECYKYRNCSIRLYEEFQKAYREMENKVKNV